MNNNSRGERIKSIETQIAALTQELDQLKTEDNDALAFARERQERSDALARRYQKGRTYKFTRNEKVIVRTLDRVVIIDHHKKLRGRTGHVCRTTKHTVFFKLEGCGTPVTKRRQNVAVIDKYDQLVLPGEIQYQR